MGNVEARDFEEIPTVEERKLLDLSRRVSHKEYCQHMNGELQDGCLSNLLFIETISLYEGLDVSFNCLPSIPEDLSLRLPHLNFLNLSHNRLTQLPDTICLLFHLHTFLLNHNNLIQLPSSFTKLTKLVKLDLSYNELQELPDDLGSMPRLTRLNLTHNKLCKLPLSLANSRSIKVILAHYNNFSFPLQSICSDGSDALLKYLSLYKSEQTTNYQNDDDVFKRIRGNQVQSSVPNLHSARAQYLQIQTQTINTVSRIRTPLMPPLNATKFDPEELRDKIVGFIYGAAVGDALGLATEFMTPDECHFHYDPANLCYQDIVLDHHRVWWDRGDWSSDFDQLLLVLDSIIQWGGVLDELDFAARLKTWSKQGFMELDDIEGHVFYPTIVKVLDDESYTLEPHSAARRLLTSEHCDELLDNGSISRSLIIGAPNFHSLAEVSCNAVRICKSTHADPRCIAASVAVALIIALILQGEYNVQEPAALEKLLKKTLSLAKEHIQDKEHIKEFEKCFQCCNYDSVEVNEMDKASHPFKPLAAGLVALRTQQDFRSSITDLIMRGGDSNSNACVAGAFLGCKFGYSQLPLPWLSGLLIKQVNWLNIKINALLDMMGLP